MRISDWSSDVCSSDLLLRGPVDSEVLLSVLRARSPQPMALTMKRKHIVPDTVSWRRDGDIAYISLSGFNRETTDRVAQAVAEARDEIGDALSGLVLDLRGNPGGLLDQAVDAIGRPSSRERGGQY